MAKVDAPLQGVWSASVREAAGELAHMLQLRRDLADLEIRHDRALLRRFALVGGTAALLVVCGLPLWLTAAAWTLAESTGWSFCFWLCLLGAVLVLPGLTAIGLSVRRLRAEFCGLRNTLAELREDAAWMREWAQQETDHPWGAR